ncbi:flagellar type III secretion system pore protein FliP [Phaeovibrio sulfidiphilus]|uniref:Flagellar biosynthetic protein FliP n=1 Tax=Phaeovibrio sulfidiphilus TaxID=1220600 RepID=A0A8J6YIU6_9PROT|nr:flagellar type III secretion system pore protein FliP [Phaeovibrio sulfidiphilus]MBE1237056.1 flagellar type III secretion system pore protein FliP [Phaeovibrio sulfidiphilus]
MTRSRPAPLRSACRVHRTALLAGLALTTLGLFFLGASVFAAPALAQSLNIDLGQGGGSTTARIVQIIALLSVLSVAPGIIITTTSFVRLVVVLSLLRTAVGTQSTPPNMVLVSLAMFLTFYIMAPTFQQAWDEGIAPLVAEQITEEQALERTIEPFRQFMLANVRASDLQLFMDYRNETVSDVNEVSTLSLVPAFMISELRRAFEIGFLIFVPFIIIDMVVASVLMSMGMMMLPPMMLAMPFKIIFFVLVDGWNLVVGTLLYSYSAPIAGG